MSRGNPQNISEAHRATTGIRDAFQCKDNKFRESREINVEIELSLSDFFSISQFARGLRLIKKKIM